MYCVIKNIAFSAVHHYVIKNIAFSAVFRNKLRLHQKKYLFSSAVE